MHILHISLARSWRGGEQQLAYLYEQLHKKEGIRQTILCPYNSALATWCEQKNYEFYCIRKSFFHLLQNTYYLKRLCQKAGIDLIHTHDAHAHSLAYYAALAGSPTKIVVSRRVDFPVKQNLLSLGKYNHPKVKRILCVSNAIREITAPSIKDKSKLKVVYSGIDPDRIIKRTDKPKLRKELGIAEDAILIGNTSAIAPHKDYHSFIQVAENILTTEANIYFVIIGYGPCFNEIQQAISDKGLSEKILMTGFRTDVAEIIHELNIFLITSETEGLGTSILDAFAAGVPVVATEAGGITELIKHEKTGLSAAVRDVQTLSKNVKSILNDPALKEKLVSGAKKHLENFTNLKMAEETLKAYREIH
jgi:L-malate glycosyltransferase